MKNSLLPLITIFLLFFSCTKQNSTCDEEQQAANGEIKKIELLKQKGVNNCWAAALSMALQVFDIHESEKELDKKFKADGRGLNLDEVDAQFSNLFPKLTTDYSSEIFTPGKSPVLPFAKIRSSIDNNNPIVIGVNNFEGHLAHALLIFDYDTEKNSVEIADPWTGKAKTFSYDVLRKLYWSETLIIKRK